MPSACNSTNCAMFVKTSGRGEPAKIDLCRLRIDWVENRPDSGPAGRSRDRTFVGNWIALSIITVGPGLDSASRSLVSRERERRLGEKPDIFNRFHRRCQLEMHPGWRASNSRRPTIPLGHLHDKSYEKTEHLGWFFLSRRRSKILESNTFTYTLFTRLCDNKANEYNTLIISDL
jgi:hypothetical protein